MQLQKIFVSILFSFLIFSSHSLWAKTLTTKVKVKNYTGKIVTYVKVVHKYSNVYKEKKSWSFIGNKKSTPKNFKVQYNVGFGTTGQDWWYVAYKLKGDNKIHYTNPRNGRQIIDTVERISKKIVKKATSIKLTKKNKLEKLAKEIINGIAQHTFNKSATKGLKKHLLRGKDRKNGVTIKLLSNGNVTFSSKSGKSTTRTSTKKI